MDKSLSDNDILNFLPNCKIIKYNELSNYDNINNLLNSSKFIIILYETKMNYGHWCCIFLNNKNNIEFFDSYGCIPDLQLKYIPTVFRKQNNELFPHLTWLLINCNNKIEYNNYKFQKNKKGINTCGRWCVVRCILSDLNIDEFYKLFKKYKNKDKIITELTYII